MKLGPCKVILVTDAATAALSGMLNDTDLMNMPGVMVLNAMEVSVEHDGMVVIEDDRMFVVPMKLEARPNLLQFVQALERKMFADFGVPAHRVVELEGMTDQERSRELFRSSADRFCQSLAMLAEINAAKVEGQLPPRPRPAQHSTPYRSNLHTAHRHQVHRDHRTAPRWRHGRWKSKV